MSKYVAKPLGWTEFCIMKKHYSSFLYFSSFYQSLRLLELFGTSTSVLDLNPPSTTQTFVWYLQKLNFNVNGTQHPLSISWDPSKKRMVGCPSLDHIISQLPSRRCAGMYHASFQSSTICQRAFDALWVHGEFILFPEW